VRNLLRPMNGIFLAVFLCNFCPQQTCGQGVPYARSFGKSKQQVEQALEALEAYSGQKLPILEGFVALGDKPLDHFERGFYQFSIELLPGEAGATVVRLSAKITAWYADRDVAKSGYEVLPSNGRLELDFLDRLQEKLYGKIASPPAASQAAVLSPRPKFDLSGVSGAPVPPTTVESTKTPNEVASLRVQREIKERRVQQLTAELKNLQEIQRNQAHPQDLLIVKKSGTPVYAKGAENSHVLFEAAADDEFQFLNAEGDWVHVGISGDSRGYLRRGAVDFPVHIAAKLESAAASAEQKFTAFRIEREETSPFPGDWSELRGRMVRIYTVQAVSLNPKDTSPAARLNYSLFLFEKCLKESAAANPVPEGVVVIFDSADGGIAGARLTDIQKVSAGAISREVFWRESYLDPADAFRPGGK
jgi:hypothetical protein